MSQDGVSGRRSSQMPACIASFFSCSVVVLVVVGFEGSSRFGASIAIVGLFSKGPLIVHSSARTKRATRSYRTRRPHTRPVKRRGRTPSRAKLLMAELPPHTGFSDKRRRRAPRTIRPVSDRHRMCAVRQRP